MAECLVAGEALVTLADADAAVVGSAIVRVAAEAGPERAPEAVRDYVRWLKGG